MGLWWRGPAGAVLQDHLRCTLPHELLPSPRIPVEGVAEAKSGGLLSLKLLICEMGKFSAPSGYMEESWV